MKTIAERVKDIIAGHIAGGDRSRVTDDASLIRDLDGDSLDMVSMVMAFEEEFDVELSDDGVEQVKTVGDAVKLVERALKVRA